MLLLVATSTYSAPICAQVVDLEFREAEIRFLETGSLGLVAGGRNALNLPY
jgi:hypothetical protein